MISRTVYPGDQGADVLELKAILRANGYSPSDGDVHDRVSVAALELFQIQRIDQSGAALKADGVAGPKTRWALYHPSGNPQRNGLGFVTPTGLTVKRTALLEELRTEHARDVREIPDGSNRSVDIDKYFKPTGLLGLAWCCAFVSWILKHFFGSNPIGGVYHVGVQRMWIAAQAAKLETTAPKPGDVFVQLFSGGTGHTGFVIGVSPNRQYVYTCEGNCGNRLKLGRRATSTINHFIDVLQDGQDDSFEHRSMVFDDAALEPTR